MGNQRMQVLADSVDDFICIADYVGHFRSRRAVAFGFNNDERLVAIGNSEVALFGLCPRIGELATTLVLVAETSLTTASVKSSRPRPRF
jgi:hypothetical protein